MGANTSTAVRQRRRKKSAPRELDYFPTPPWATRAFCEWLAGFYQGMSAGPQDDYWLNELDAWEPAAGELHMVNPLAEYFRSVRASDCHEHVPGLELFDFPLLGPFEPDSVDWVITNPPFNLAQEFIETGQRVARHGVAMLVRTAFLEGQGRYETLFDVNKPHFILQHTERVLMLENRLIKIGAPDPCRDDDKPASTATAYCWLIWLTIGGQQGAEVSEFQWLPPCRHRFERAGDYPVYKPDEFEALPLFEGDQHERRNDQPRA